MDAAERRPAAFVSGVKPAVAGGWNQLGESSAVVRCEQSAARRRHHTIRRVAGGIEYRCGWNYRPSTEPAGRSGATASIGIDRGHLNARFDAMGIVAGTGDDAALAARALVAAGWRWRHELRKSAGAQQKTFRFEDD